MKILVIEDEKLLADSLKTMLEAKGFEVETAYDGETGAEYAELGIYDLLIMDVMMPKLNGYQLAREVRAKRCATPILMLTAKSGLMDRVEGLNAGADYYLTKPFDARELLACINALLRRQGNQVDVMTCGNTTLVIACQLVIPRDLAASVCPLSMAMIPPLRTSVIYAVELSETVKSPEMKKLHTLLISVTVMPEFLNISNPR